MRGPVLASVLLHLIIGWLCWQQDLPKITPPAPAIATFLYQPATPRPVSKAVPPLPKPAAASTAQQVGSTAGARSTTAAAKSRPAPIQPRTRSQRPTTTPPVSAPKNAPAIVGNTALPPSDNRTLAERSLAAVAARQLQPDNNLLQQIRQKPELREPAAVKPHRLAKPGHVAADVIAVTADGSFIEKIGDGCVLAQNGADLRKDIFSVKAVPCGKDHNEAMFERIMGNIGQHHNNPAAGGGKPK